MHESSALREIQSVNPKLIALPVIEGEADVCKLHDPMKTGSDSSKKFSQIEFRNYGVVHVEQEARNMMLACELLLNRLCLFEVTRCPLPPLLVELPGVRKYIRL
jgi:hypothetical protein